MLDRGVNDLVNRGRSESVGFGNLQAFLLILTLSGLSVPVLAQVELNTAVSKVLNEQDEKGKPVRRLVDATKVMRGDTLQYVISFSNKGSSVVDAGSIVITNPLPPDTEYLEGTAQGSGTDISFSVDSGATFGQPGELKVVRDGVEVAARAADYTTIRWTFKQALDAGKTGDVTFSVRLK